MKNPKKLASRGVTAPAKTSLKSSRGGLAKKIAPKARKPEAKMPKTQTPAAKTARPSWDEYFMSICEIVGSRGTCDRGKSGSIIVKNRRIITTGYVGSPAGLPHCDEVGHEMHKVTHDDGRETMHCIRTVHAEQNALIQAAKVGNSVKGADLYCKMVPCYVCAKLIINAGVVRVVAQKDYQASVQTKRVFQEAAVELVVLDKEVEKY